MIKHDGLEADFHAVTTGLAVINNTCHVRAENERKIDGRQTVAAASIAEPIDTLKHSGDRAG